MSLCTLGDSQWFRVRLGLQGCAGQRKIHPVSDPTASCASFQKVQKTTGSSSEQLKSSLLAAHCLLTRAHCLSASLALNPANQRSSLFPPSSSISSNRRTSWNKSWVFICFVALSFVFSRFSAKERAQKYSFSTKAEINWSTRDWALQKVSVELKELPPNTLWSQATCCLR